MERFGFLSARLNIPGFWRTLAEWAPESLLYHGGPLKAGEIKGDLVQAHTRESLSGWGWKAPAHLFNDWDSERFQRIWPKFLLEASREDVGVIGVDPGIPAIPMVQTKSGFPVLSDGKAWELLFFIHRFRSVLRNHSIPPHKAKAAIIWEEGNLGATCARLLARDLRFLTLITPQPRLLERVADQILSEAGISAQITSDVSVGLKGVRIAIVCGPLRFYRLPRDSGRTIWCELFYPNPSLPVMNLKIPLTITHRKKPLPVYPALGEAIVRCNFGMRSGNWCGPELPLERVLKLACLCKEIGMGAL